MHLLRGWSGGKLFVVPGWQYRFVAALLPKLPTGLRLLIERRATQSRYRQLVESGK